MPTVMALFHTPYDAEQAVAELSLNGFTEKDVAMMLFTTVQPSVPGGRGLSGWLARGGFLGDTIDRSDGVSFIDGTGVAATIGCLLGMVYGSQLRWGPVAWATFGLLGGGLVGYVIDRLIPEKRRDQLETSNGDGVILIEVSALVKERAETALGLLKANRARQVTMLPGVGSETVKR